MAGWRHKQRQLEAAKVSACAAKAMQSEQTVGTVLDEEVEAVGAEEEEEGNLPLCCIRHAREASRVRALNEVLGGELQPEELLLKAVEAPWKEEESDEVSSGEEVEGLASLQPGGPAPKRLRDESRGLGGRGKQRKRCMGTAERSRKEGTGARLVEHARVQCRPW